MPLLAVNDLTVTFGGIHAVEGCSFGVDTGEIVALIGPNGAGKTTLLNAVSGFVRSRGSILLETRELIRTPAHRRAKLGIGRTFQNVQLFPDMTLAENLMLAHHLRLKGNLLVDIARFPVIAADEVARLDSLALLATLGIAKFAESRARDLPFGVQKLGGVARALTLRPKVLLMDEPAAGLNHVEAANLGEVIRALRREFAVSILLVEHNMRVVMGISDRVIVLDDGRKLMEGTPAEVSQDSRVIAAYLGEEAAAEQRA